MPLRIVIATALSFISPALLQAQPSADPFAARTFVSPAGSKMPYRIFIPSPAARTKPLPLVIYLHGSGGAGTDNLLQISGGNTKGSHLWVREDIQARHPAFVIAPQAPADEQWGRPDTDSLATYAQVVVQLIDQLKKEFSIDPDRIYLTGQSRGGIGVWDIISKRPNLFAAAIPLCGAGDPDKMAAAKRVSVWAFHGADDKTVPVEGSRELIAAFKKAGASPRYTEYPGVGHAVWEKAYEEKELPEWLFQQRRGSSRTE